MQLVMRPLSDFLRFVMPHAPGAPEIVAERCLRLAAIEFCERTRCWRQIRSFTMTVPGRSLVAAPYATIHEIERATFDGAPLTPIQFSDISQDLLTGGGTPAYITQANPNSVIVYPHAEGVLELSLFLKPRADSEFLACTDEPMTDLFSRVPEHMFIQHAEAIAFGALARLLLMPKTEYFNANLGAYYEGKARERMDGLFSANLRGQHRAARRVRFHDF